MLSAFMTMLRWELYISMQIVLADRLGLDSTHTATSGVVICSDRKFNLPIGMHAPVGSVH